MANIIVRIYMKILEFLINWLGIFEKVKADFDKQLRDFIQSHNHDKAKEWLHQDLIDMYKGDYGTLLHHAAEWHNKVILKDLIDLGDDVDRLAPDGKTALMIALERGSRQCVILLLEANADVDRIVNAEGKTALQTMYELRVFDPRGYRDVIDAFHARIKSQTSSVEEFIDKLIGAGCAMFHAAYLNDVGILQSLTRRGLGIDSAAADGKTALHAAAIMGKLGLTKWFTDNGADVNAVDEDNNGTLYFAAQDGNAEIMRHLLELGADLNTRNGVIGLTPLFAAVAFCSSDTVVRHIECVELLARHGAVPRNATLLSDTIFDYALSNGNFEVANVLVGHLAVLERLGTCEAESVMFCREEEHQEAMDQVKRNFEMCRRMLDVKVFKKVTLLDLLTKSEHKMKQLVRKETFVSTVENFYAEHKLIESCTYYYNSLTKSISTAKKLLALEHAAISVICDIFGGNYNQGYIAARKIVDYLDKPDVMQLSYL